MAGAAIPDVYAPPMPATTLGNMVKTFLQKILDITVIQEVEPIVSRELWDACNEHLEERLKAYKRPARRSPQLFTGYMFCSCGGKMYVPSNSRKYVCNDCKNKIAVDDVESIYHNQLTQFFLSSEEHSRYAQEADSEIREMQMLIDALRRELEKTKKEMEKLYQLYLSDEISPDGFGTRNRPLEERQTQIENELPRLEGMLDTLKSDLLSRDVMISEGTQLFDQWSTFSAEKKKQIIDAITDSIVISNDTVAINFGNYHPSASDHNLATNPQGFMAATSWTRAG